MNAIHNHFNCPICKDEYAATDIYGELYDYVEKYGDSIVCGECNSEFIFTEGSSPFAGKWKLKE